MTAILLGLAAGIGWGFSDFMAGAIGRRASPISVGLVTQIVGSLVVVVALVAVRPDAPTTPQILWGALAGISVGAGTIGLYSGLSSGSMSLIAPISSVGVLVPVAFGLLGGERPSAVAVVGMVFVMAGLLVCGGARGPAGREGFAWAGLAAAGFGLFFVFLDLAAEDGALWATAASWTTSGVVLAAVVIITRSGRFPRPGRDLALTAVSGGLAAGAGLSFAVATGRGLLSLVAVLTSLYPAITLALAQLTLGERLGRLQWAGVITVFAGVGAIVGGA